MEDNLSRINELIEKFAFLVEENKRLKEEKKKLEDENKYLRSYLVKCRKEITYIKSLRDRALKKIEKAIEEIERLK